VNRVPLITSDRFVPAGLDNPRWLTQGSRNLALGLTLTAASQLVDAL